MATGKLSATYVRSAKKGKHGDGGGLWLYVDDGKSWVYRYAIKGRERYMGLGAYPDVSLSDAREAASQARKLKFGGIDPLDYKKALALQDSLADAKTMTFGGCAKKYIEAHRSGWTNEKHAQQWINTLRDYAQPINDLPVAGIDVGLVMQCLEPIWYTKAETASRVRMRIENILDWAEVMGYRKGDNPARLKGRIDKLLPPRAKVAPVKHHAALPYTEIPGFMGLLQEKEGIGALALEFTILTACRTGEVLGAHWSEIEGNTWTIPKERMKAGKAHRVPLSRRCEAILSSMASIRTGNYVFPGARPGRGLSNMTMMAVLRRMGRDDITVHGFRSAFRDWTAERTATPNIVAEQALAHTISNEAEAAYRRGDLLAKRRKLMDTWAAYCESKPGDVVHIGAAKELVNTP